MNQLAKDFFRPSDLFQAADARAMRAKQPRERVTLPSGRFAATTVAFVLSLAVSASGTPTNRSISVTDASRSATVIRLESRKPTPLAEWAASRWGAPKAPAPSAAKMRGLIASIRKSLADGD